MTKERQIPHRCNPTGMFPGFEVVTQGWPASGYKSQYNQIAARYVEGDASGQGQAQITYEIVQNYEKRSQTMCGSINLTQKQAIEFAMQIVPPHIASAIAALASAAADE